MCYTLSSSLSSHNSVVLRFKIHQFTGYINRMRGYHSTKDMAPGYKNGELPKTFYYITKDRKFEMHKYAPLRGGFFSREYPTSWRDIDKGTEELTAIARHH
jgi:hypothetical protein